MSEGASGFFVRMNGKTLGPFSLAQLQAFRDKGRLRSEHELSLDRERWYAAGRVPELFATPESPATYSFAGEEPSSSPRVEVEWYVEVDGERRGPLPLARVRALIAAGKLTEDDLAWRQGLRDWQRVEDFPELVVEEGASAPTNSRLKGRARSQNRAGFWNRFLQAVRQLVTEDDLERTCRSMISLGKASMALGALVAATFLIILAMERDNLSGAMMAATIGMVLLALQFVGSRMAEASLKLATASRYRLSSNAFPSSVGVALLAAGLFAGASLITIQVERAASVGRSTTSTIQIVIGVVFAIEVFIPFFYGFFASLHPQWMSVDCGESVGAGEDGVGACAFLLKVGLRFVPISFGVSAILGAFGSIAAVAMYFGGNELRIDAVVVSAASQASLFAAATIPTAWYLLASLASIVLDFMLPNVRVISDASRREQKVV